jgi:hypothetical protein
VETNTSADDVESELARAIADNSVFSVTDTRGGKIIVPIDKLAYLELVGVDTHRIGFGPSI